MTRTSLTLASAVLALAAALLPSAASGATPPLTTKPTAAQEKAILGALAWHFEENHGQAPSGVQYFSMGDGYQVEIRPGGPTLASLSNGKRVEVRTLAVGANIKAEITAEQPSAMKANYFLGNKANAWRSNVDTWSRVRYHDIYPNIDLIFYGAGRNLEFDFEVRPGADPERIAMTWKGAKQSHLDADGNLIISTSAGELRWSKPVIYQLTKDAGKTKIDGGFLLSKNVARFRVSEYDHSAPLVIDPAIGFATFIGGSSNDSARSIAVDASGNILVAGITSTATLPTTGTSAQPGYGGSSSSNSIAGDAFIAQLNPAGSAVNWLTYLGGGADDVALGLAVDTGGNVYVTGMTNSTNFPVKNANTASFSGSGGNRLNPMGDAFLTKLTASGQLAYSTYFGGSQDDWAMAIAVDSSGNAYITGATLSNNLQTQFSSFQKGYKGTGGNLAFPGSSGPLFALGDAFVAKFDGNGKLAWSTYLGGAKDEIGTSIAVDKTGNVYVGGLTLSSDFPVTAGVLQGKFGGQSDDQSNPWAHLGDGFVVKFDPAGSNLLFSTYLGGSKDDGIFGLAVDGAGNVYVTGATLSPDFPVTSSPLQNSFKGPSAAPLVPTGIATNIFGDGFVAKLNPQATALVYSTYFGGTGDDSGQAIAIDTAGNAYVTGNTSSKDFPTTSGAPQTAYTGGGVYTRVVGDAFFLELNATGNQLLFSTYLGSSGDDAGGGVAIDGNGNAFIAGVTTSPLFPVTKGAFQTTYGGNNRLGTPAGDAFVAKITGLGAGNNPVISNVGNAASYKYGVVSPGEIVVVFGTSMAAAPVTVNAPDTTGVFGTLLAGTRVYFNNIPSPIYYTSAAQLSVIAPYALAGQSTANVQVEYNGVRSGNFPVTVQDAVPGLFTAQASGSGAGAFFNGDFTANTPSNPVPQNGSFFMFLTGEGVTNPPSIDGRVANGTYPAIVPPVSVTVGGVPALIQYAGAVPTLVAGISQINVQLGPNTPSGNQNVVVTIRGVASQANVTVAVQ